ncbi:MAG: hypothetical protein KAS59_08625, partial [Alphaproteobacteria bacterium]|nr:hypothetical protein [Alphaproteobacteria bacterium]
TTFTIDTAAPTVTLSDDHPDLTVKDADTVAIIATFNENMTSTPTVSIDVLTDADADIVDAAMTPWSCGDLIIEHTAGDVAPVTRPITYGTVITDLSGDSKCWITQNLGAFQQATSVSDDASDSAGWYWQFNLKQGYEFGGIRIPATAWIDSIDQDSDWTADNDPCTIELGADWRLPTSTEWTNADANGEVGGWDNRSEAYSDVLKLHTAGFLHDFLGGGLFSRGSLGYSWSSTQSDNTNGYVMYFEDNGSLVLSNCNKATGASVRCLRDYSTASAWTYSWNVPAGHSGDTATVTVAGDDITGNAYAGSDEIVYTIDNTAPDNQDTVFAVSISIQGGAVDIVSSGEETNNVWFAPLGTTTFVEGATMTKAASGTATSILAPETEGAYKLYVIDAAGNRSAASTATLTVDNTAPTISSVTLSPSTGTLKVGDEVVITVTSSSNDIGLTPSTATFNGQEITLSVNCGNTVNFTYRGGSVTYGTVAHNSKCWLDRNLGASQVATAYNDSAAYGDLFQWGRLDDNHQDRGSATTSTNSSTDDPGHSGFIMEPDYPRDWRDPQNDNLWQGVSGVNNPCPSGWRIPTDAELEAERVSWSSNDYNGAYASPLKLPATGSRDSSDGSLYDVGSHGRYWSSMLNGTRARYLFFSTEVYTYMISYSRARGFSVRCIKDGATYTGTYTIIEGHSNAVNPEAANITLTDPAGNVSSAGSSGDNTLTIDANSPANQDTVFAVSISKQGGATVVIVSSGEETNNVWFAPTGTTTFVEGTTMTKAASGTATSILAPETEGAYKLFVIDAAGNRSAESTATLTVDNTAPTISSVTLSPSTGTLKVGDEVLITVTSDSNEQGLTPSTATFNGQEITLSENPCGNTVNFTYRGGSVTYGTVAHNSECWLDRNLGASQVSTAYDDSAAYGDLFQWGRLDDNHQDRGSATTSTTSSTDDPGHSSFIMEPNAPADWRDPQNDNLWQGVSGVNNPCPSGWRIPTDAELEAERVSWSSNDCNGAYASPLKFSVTGWRGSDGIVGNAGISGNQISSTVSGTNVHRLNFNSSGASMDGRSRVNGYSVRCIKDGATYTGTYTIIEGHSDAYNPKATNITLTDPAGNVSSAGSSGDNTLTIDANSPANQDTVFAVSISIQGGATVVIVSSGEETNNVWFAPTGTTTFVEGTTMTKAASGTATSILAPATEGAYKLFVIDAAGNRSAASTATLTVDNT